MKSAIATLRCLAFGLVYGPTLPSVKTYSRPKTKKPKMNKLLLFFIALTALICPKVNFAQSPNLGAAADFVLFSSIGAVSNTGVSKITGNVGSNSGAVSGFGNVNGQMHTCRKWHYGTSCNRFTYTV